MANQLLTFGGNQPLVDAIVRYGVRFFVMGGSAARFFFPQWQTDDLDLLVELTVANGERIIGALQSLGCPPIGWTSERLARRHAQMVLKKETGTHYNADILTPTAEFDFLAHWPLAVDAWVGVTPVKV